MQVSTFLGPELPKDLLNRWREICRTTRAYDSPFFDPGFTLAVAQARPDVKVAVVEHEQSPIAFFPFQQSGERRIAPVGFGVSDKQGIIRSAGANFDLRELLDRCDLGRWRFDQLVDVNADLLPYWWAVERAPYIEIPDGFENYRVCRRKAGSLLVEQALRKERKLSRERGELRLVWHECDLSAFHSLLAWKGAQRRATRTSNALDTDWVLSLLKLLLATDMQDFGGVLSALYVSDELASVHFGIRTPSVLHWWFPTYNPKFQEYSPGLILLVSLIREANSHGVRRIDLGKGLERYKYSVMTGTDLVIEGAAGYGRLATLIGASWSKLRHTVRHSILREHVQATKHSLRVLRRY